MFVEAAGELTSYSRAEVPSNVSQSADGQILVLTHGLLHILVRVVFDVLLSMYLFALMLSLIKLFRLLALVSPYEKTDPLSLVIQATSYQISGPPMRSTRISSPGSAQVSQFSRHQFQYQKDP